MTVAERSSVRFGGTRIDYAIRRSRRRGTVSVVVDPTDGVVLTAPARTPVTRLDAVVHTKAPWIVQRLRRVSDIPPPLPAREFTSGETFLYLGRQYRLRVEPEAREVGPLVMSAGWLHVRLPPGLDAEHSAAFVRAALVDWYRRRARERLPEVVATWARRLDVAVADVLVRDQRKRWASCDARGTLRFNWRVIQAPASGVAYVVAHELVHLLHRDHSAAFWRTLGRVMPDYEKRRAALRAIGPRLEW